MFDIWAEGDPNLDFTAYSLGKVPGTDFLDACTKLKNQNKHYSENIHISKKDFIKYKNCRLFPSELEARASFG